MTVFDVILWNLAFVHLHFLFKEINGELQESFSVIKENKDGTFEMQTFFIINESAATRARIRAYENALKESEAAQKYAQKVSDFVREGFEPKSEN